MPRLPVTYVESLRHRRAGWMICLEKMGDSKVLTFSDIFAIQIHPHPGASDANVDDLSTAKDSERDFDIED